jgi:hypothetical protein
VTIFDLHISQAVALNHLKTSIHKKNIVEVTFFKTSKWRSVSRWHHQPLFYTLGPCKTISQPNFNMQIAQDNSGTTI